ncbi:MAG: DUF4912 domain-containing protein [Candidatus Omnitrophica bacterium]|nr:DUF4912 domain-containing protein [Candidatus Omnitrophota bacterium]
MRRLAQRVKDAFKEVIRKAGSIAKWTRGKKQAVRSKIAVQEKVTQPRFYREPKREVQKIDKPQQLPTGYGKDKIVLRVRDPYWIYAYWEITESTWEKLRRETPSLDEKTKIILRVYDTTDTIFDGSNAHSFFDIVVNSFANNWHIETKTPARSWCVDLGLLLPDNRFLTIVRSNIVSTPIAGPSCINDQEWMVTEDMFARLYGVGVGASPVKRGKPIFLPDSKQVIPD